MTQPLFAWRRSGPLAASAHPHIQSPPSPASLHPQRFPQPSSSQGRATRALPLVRAAQPPGPRPSAIGQLRAHLEGAPGPRTKRPAILRTHRLADGAGEVQEHGRWPREDEYPGPGISVFPTTQGGPGHRRGRGLTEQGSEASSEADTPPVVSSSPHRTRIHAHSHAHAPLLHGWTGDAVQSIAPGEGGGERP
ncbi:uncharacterized protein ACOB8E_020812 [Sarcophilus harrisii]